MGKLAETDRLDMRRLRESWLIELRAQRKSPATIRAYSIGTDLFLGAHTELTKPTVMEWLAKAYDARDVHLIYLPVDPKWDPYRVDPRFQALLTRCGFTPSARAEPVTQ